MRFTALTLFVAALAVLWAIAGPAQASVITTGDVDPGGAGTHPDPWALGGNLYVGYSGFGTLKVEAGGVVSNTDSGIGYKSGSTGIATVSGSGSQWNNSDHLYVGFFGSGTLNIEAGGVVTNTNGDIGFISGSTGIATVTGTGSWWDNSSNLHVGYTGHRRARRLP